MRSLPDILQAAASNARLAEDEKDALLALSETIGRRARPDTGAAIGDGPDRGSPYGVHDTVIDGSRALLLDASDVAMSDQSDGRRIAVMQLSGRINRSQDRATFAVLTGPDGLAAIVTEIIGLMQRERGRFASEFQADFARRMAAMP